jgi:hypothetical protein
MRTKLILLMVFLGLIFFPLALADQTAQVCKLVPGAALAPVSGSDIPLRQTAYSTSIDIPKFDPGLGVLDKVYLTIDACGRQKFQLDNEDPQPLSTFDVSHSGKVRVRVPVPVPDVVDVEVSDTSHFTLPADNDDAPDFVGDDSYTRLIEKCANPPANKVYDQPSDLAEFTASSPGIPQVMNLAVNASGNAVVSGDTGNFATFVSTQMGAKVCVVYEYHTLSISGSKINDCTDEGLAGWEIILKKDGAQVASTNTVADGSYSFTGLQPGTYQVCETPQTGWTAIGDTCKPVTLTTTDVNGVNFRNKPDITITCPPAVTIECPDSLDPAVNDKLGYATATVIGGGTATVTYTDSPEGTCPTIVTRTWTATYGTCTESCTQIITVDDTIAPVLPDLPGGDLGCNPAVLPSCTEGLKATDACDGEVAVVCTPGEVTGDGCGKQQIFTYSATDACGNTATGTATYTWKVDTEAPVNVVPAGGNLGCNPATLPTIESVTALVSATDNCGTVTPVVTVAEDSMTGCTVTRVFTVTTTDACGNVDTDTVTYIWKYDETAPVLSNLPEGGDLGCNPAVLPSCTEGLKATDNCDGEIPVSCAPGEITGEGCDKAQVFTYSATDACGNTATDTVTFTWKEDTEAPEFILPEGGDLGCNTPPECEDIIANDNCDGPIPMSCTRGEITYDGCIATQTFTYTAEDACGNIASGTVTYTWTEDTEAPMITCPPDQDFTTLADLNAYLAAYPDCEAGIASVTAPDNCDPNPEVICTGETDNGLSGCDEPRVITRTYRATDDCGNSAECTQTITLQAETPDCTITVSADPVPLGSTDNTASVVSVAGATYSWTVTGGTITAGQGTPQITWTADTAGTVTISVTITSAEGCSATCDETVTVEAPQACGTAMANWGMDDPNYPDVGTPGHVNDGFLKNARWGWYTIVPLSDLTGAGVTSDVWIGAGLNDLSKATKVGSVTISVNDGILNWDFDGSCTGGDTHVYVSTKSNAGVNGFGKWFQTSGIPVSLGSDPNKPVYVAFHIGGLCCVPVPL